MPKKRDAVAIREFLEGLPSALGLDPLRRWWPKYVYRSDHVENAARILTSGRVLSRRAAEAEGAIVVDAASQRHIAELARADRDLVRLYFRPRTPTQYCNEGIRPRPLIQYGAHMPVPVYLLFDAKEVLTDDGVSFSRGRLVPGAARGSSRVFLETLDFLKVYHDSGVGQVGAADRGDILNARHSEVLVPRDLKLDSLRLVVCRSAPERDTLLNLLSAQARRMWLPKIVLEGPRSVFYKRGIFVSEAALLAGQSRFSFFTQTLGREWRGPFVLEVTWTDDTGWTTTQSVPEFRAEQGPVIFGLSRPRSRYAVRVTLDGNLAYLGAFAEPLGPSVL